MVDLIGWTVLLVAAGATFLLASCHRGIAIALGAAFSARAIAALFHYYVAPLPDGTADAVRFERYAWEWSQGGIGEALNHFTIGSDFYSWLMSLLYAVTDRSLLMLQATSVLIGVLGVFFAYRLTQELWEERHARKVAWVMALFPTVVQYGALTMREVWVVLFFILGLIGVVRWAKKGGFKPVASGIAAFTAATFFHGGMFVAVIAFLGLISARAGHRLLSGLSRGRVGAFAVVGLIVGIGGVGGYIGSGVSLPKLGTAAEATDLQRWIERFQYQQSLEYAEARYGNWQVPSHPGELAWIVPVKSVYFLFSPFPWDLRAPKHLIGLVDALLYFGLAFLVWRHRRSIWADPGRRAVLMILLAMVLTFGVGTSNFGTAMRHRAKFVVALIALAAPRLPRLVFRSRSTSSTHGSPSLPKQLPAQGA
ncbi:glycosyltransferase family 39 protein [Halorhodospira neutriphila]|uniref:Glycosyltransferase RgtA/B/C/D-like domain-containing protein n=1 Tax=Halorhodospira neutriphila TaxID=168379 RepID=A0ABS1E7W3_9GAMM|nr:glycosyltransferase family 39 protein [Halorhodospira neutriphila]MBK1726384.1 hypothetical protein [Halorhodospira neutriphila]